MAVRWTVWNKGQFACPSPAELNSRGWAQVGVATCSHTDTHGEALVLRSMVEGSAARTGIGRGAVPSSFSGRRRGAGCDRSMTSSGSGVPATRPAWKITRRMICASRNFIDGTTLGLWVLVRLKTIRKRDAPDSSQPLMMSLGLPVKSSSHDTINPTLGGYSAPKRIQDDDDDYG